MCDMVAWGEVEACLYTFEAHLTKSVEAVFAKENTNLALISGRLTSVLQPTVFLE